MLKTPKSLRLHIGFLGRRNVGKSSLINKITGQDVSIVSDTAGTTTDPVEKAMELPPIGPVLFVDTAGVDDVGELGAQRVEKTLKALERLDIAVIVCDSDGWGNEEIELQQQLRSLKIPVFAIINKTDLAKIAPEKRQQIAEKSDVVLEVSTFLDDDIALSFKQELIKILPNDFVNTPTILGDLLPENALVLLVTPIDKEAPKGRLILPQVQTIRDILDNAATTVVTRDSELQATLKKLALPPDIVVTDSQAFKFVDEIVPKNVPLTSFSILFARLKGDLDVFAQGALVIDELKDGDKILICESCTHHSIEDDIGKVKIPNLIKKHTGKEIIFEHYSSHDFPQNIDEYKLIIHCGGCMTNKREILSRILKSKKQNVPITNYGITIAHCLGILDRALAPFKAEM